MHHAKVTWHCHMYFLWRAYSEPGDPGSVKISKLPTANRAKVWLQMILKCHCTTDTQKRVPAIRVQWHNAFYKHCSHSWCSIIGCYSQMKWSCEWDWSHQRQLLRVCRLDHVDYVSSKSTAWLHQGLFLNWMTSCFLVTDFYLCQGKKFTVDIFISLSIFQVNPG